MSDTSNRIGVLGAAGVTGRTIVAALAARGVQPRAIIRKADYADRFPGSPETAVARFEDIGELAAALDGCAAAYYVPPVFNDREEDFAANIVEATSRAGTGRLVYHSVLHAPTPAMPHHARKARVELMLRESEIAWTILQPAMYVGTALSFLSEDGAELSPPFDLDKPFSPIAMPDLAEAAANVLCDDAYAFGTFELAGPERLSFRQMATHLGEARNAAVEACRGDLETQVARRSQRLGWSDRQQREYRAMLAHYDAHGLPGNAMTLAMILGRAPTGFAAAAGAA